MKDYRTLTMEFNLRVHENIVAAELLSLTKCVDQLTRAIVENEVLEIIRLLNIPDDFRLQKTVHGVIYRRVPPPVDIIDVRKGSWIIIASLGGSVLLYLLKKAFESTVLPAWQESDVGHRVKNYFRDRCFGGTEKAINTEASRSPNFGNLSIEDVIFKDNNANPHLKVQLEQKRILELRSTIDTNTSIDALIEQLTNKSRQP